MPTPPTLRLRTRLAAPVAALALVGLLGSCSGERPTLDANQSRPTASSTTATNAPGSSTSTTAASPTAPVAAVPGPDTLLGYIATPTGAPVVKAEPAEAAAPIEVPSTTSAGAPTTFAIVGDPTVASSGWYEVLLPTRPNGATAWVPASSVTITKTPFRLFVDLPGRTIRVERDGAEVLNATVAIGTDENPTPTGASYVTELIDNVNPGGAYGPYAFGLALHSDTLTEFAGGPGQVGIHGTNEPQLIGQAVSHGCVRLANADIEALVGLQLPLGVPVFIT